MSSEHEKPWLWNEFQQIGVDYANIDEVRAYDERMGKFRDVDAENRRVLEALNLESGETVLEIGAGTGALSIAAARLCSKVIAFDISEPMLALAKEKAANQGAGNIVFMRGGLLSCDMADESADAVITQLALHHLPDFWKMVALNRIARILRPGGRLWLMDVVYSFEVEDHARFFDELMARSHPEMRASLESHVRQEYSTVSWVMEGMLERAGFVITEKEYVNGFLARYLCVKA